MGIHMEDIYRYLFKNTAFIPCHPILAHHSFRTDVVDVYDRNNWLAEPIFKGKFLTFYSCYLSIRLSPEIWQDIASDFKFTNTIDFLSKQSALTNKPASCFINKHIHPSPALFVAVKYNLEPFLTSPQEVRNGCYTTETYRLRGNEKGKPGCKIISLNHRLALKQCNQVQS
jgi:hypothetical protein